MHVMLRSIFKTLIAACCAVCLAFGDETSYGETLLLNPLPQSSLLASFNFRSNTSRASFEAQNFQYFPRALGQTLQYAHTRELHLRFSSGRWDADSWGTRPRNGIREGGTGVELWAWVEADGDDEFVYRTSDFYDC